MQGPSFATADDGFSPRHPRAQPRLFDALPGLAAEVPWRPLAHLPTPVEPLSGRFAFLGPGQVAIKRDDLISPRYGGNKVRRYEFVLADILARSKRHIVTAGGLASTQVTATASFAEALGLGLTAVLFDQPVTRFAREAVLADVSLGAELVYGGSYLNTALETARALRRVGPQGALILPGAATPRANLGYLDAVFELEAQVRAGHCARPDVVLLPTGSSGTLAALSLGFAFLGWPTEVVGVTIASPWVCNRLTVGRVVRETARWIAARDKRFHPSLAHAARWRLDGVALGRGYGHPSPEAVAGIARVQQITGAPGEVTYSGKALAGLSALLRDPRYQQQNILWWNTLSTPRPALAPDAEARVPRALRWVLAAPLVA
ncbi:MAG: pyridoxal-phosphate dependent enzyme [Myxococcales bacterium]|nr:pyridoxal-phosphate dependent enzyme [Myxococcales bacterium]